ncbi:hypothetical protein TNCV_3598011 [Trichonephila clavipes]|nr:hypothetical protein TNCV_3598011 [Trichonephila clavipes]
MTTHERAPPLTTTTLHQREDFRVLDRFNVQCFPTRRVFSGTGFELMTSQPRTDTLTTSLRSHLLIVRLLNASVLRDTVSPYNSNTSHPGFSFWIRREFFIEDCNLDS